MSAEPCRDCGARTTRRTALTDQPQCRSCSGFAKGTFEQVKPLPAGKPLAPYRAPAAPGHAKFRDIPGQGMLSPGNEEPGRIDYEDGAP